MVGLLDYFQPRRAVGLLGLPIEQQVVGEGLLGGTVLPDVLGAWGGSTPGLLTGLAEIVRSPLLQPELGDQAGIPLRFMGGPADQATPLTLLDHGFEAQSPGLLPRPHKQITASGFGKGLLGGTAMLPQDLPNASGDDPETARPDLPAEPVYPFVQGGPGDEGAPVRITVRPLRAIQTSEPNGQGGYSISDAAQFLPDSAARSADTIPENDKATRVDGSTRGPDLPEWLSDYSGPSASPPMRRDLADWLVTPEALLPSRAPERSPAPRIDYLADLVRSTTRPIPAISPTYAGINRDGQQEMQYGYERAVEALTRPSSDTAWSTPASIGLDRSKTLLRDTAPVEFANGLTNIRTGAPDYFGSAPISPWRRLTVDPIDALPSYPKELPEWSLPLAKGALATNHLTGALSNSAANSLMTDAGGMRKAFRGGGQTFATPKPETITLEQR